MCHRLCEYGIAEHALGEYTSLFYSSIVVVIVATWVCSWLVVMGRVFKGATAYRSFGLNGWIIDEITCLCNRQRNGCQCASPPRRSLLGW